MRFFRLKTVAQTEGASEYWDYELKRYIPLSDLHSIQQKLNQDRLHIYYKFLSNRRFQIMLLYLLRRSKWVHQKHVNSSNFVIHSKYGNYQIIVRYGL